MSDDNSRPVYRFFKRESEADALAQGDVWLSTLETCRAYEDPKQGDPEEAHEIYNTGYCVGGSGDPSFVEVARRASIHIGPGCSGIVLSNNTRRSVIRDAYVLCTTSKYSPEMLGETFGKFCVEINNPSNFFFRVSDSLEKIQAIEAAIHGGVVYRDRFYEGMEPPPGPIGFVKPSDIYAEQKEFRFLWIPKNFNKITPFLLKCPEVSNICRRIA